MENKKIVSTCFYIAAAGLYIAAIIWFIIGKSIYGNVFLCLGSVFLCLSSLILNKYKKCEDDQNKKR